ncbi:MAG: hypothetical protein IJK98_09680, partial [Clostridia bacterium]|nr:hypothetical protein [Clostridia bacterium]
GNILADAGVITAEGGEGDTDALRRPDRSFWRYDGKAPGVIRIELPEEEPFDKIVLQEHIENGQHIESFTVEALNQKGRWIRLYEGSTVGYKKICPVSPTKTKCLRISVNAFRSFFELSHIQLN